MYISLTFLGRAKLVMATTLESRGLYEPIVILWPNISILL